jgi:hypothetical protein
MKSDAWDDGTGPNTVLIKRTVHTYQSTAAASQHSMTACESHCLLVLLTSSTSVDFIQRLHTSLRTVHSVFRPHGSWIKPKSISAAIAVPEKPDDLRIYDDN